MTTADNNNSRTGFFGPAMRVYGLIMGSYLSMEMQRQVECVFGADSVLSSGQYPYILLKLHSFNAKHILEAKLPELCMGLDLDRIDVLDMSDWTVREFALHTPKEK